MVSMHAPRFLARAAEVALRTVSGYGEDRVSISAAGITYFALISIFPMALVGLSVAGFVYSGAEDQQRLLDDIMDHLPIDEASGREDLEGVITSVVEARGTLGVIGILSALYTGSALFTAVRVALNGIFRGEKPRPFFIGKLIDIAMVVLFGALLLASILTSFMLTVFSRLVDDVVGEDAATITRLGVTLISLLIPPLISGVVFLILYAKIPASAVNWRYAIPGALLAAILFEVLKAGFGIYAANFTNYDATYGSLGFVILLLAFIYFASQVMLLGAETARATSEVARGWPFSEEESKVAGVRRKIAKVRRKIDGWLGRKSELDLSLDLPVAVHGAEAVEVEPVVGPPVPEPVRHEREHHQNGHPRAGWLGAAALFGGVMAAAFAISRRR